MPVLKLLRKLVWELQNLHKYSIMHWKSASHRHSESPLNEGNLKDNYNFGLIFIAVAIIPICTYNIILTKKVTQKVCKLLWMFTRDSLGYR